MPVKRQRIKNDFFRPDRPYDLFIFKDIVQNNSMDGNTWKLGVKKGVMNIVEAHGRRSDKSDLSHDICR